MNDNIESQKRAILTQNVTTAMRLGAAQGLTAWVAYGAVEYFFITIAEGAYHPRYVFLPGHWSINLLLFGMYAGFGLMVGSVAGIAVQLASRKVSWLRSADGEILQRLVVLLSLVVAFSANLVYRLPHSGLTKFALLISVALVLGVVLSAFSSTWESRLAFVTNPWAVGLLLVAPLWLIKSPLNPWKPGLAGGAVGQSIKLLLALALTLAIILGSLLVRKMWARAQGQKRLAATPPSLGGSLARLVPVVLALLVVSTLVDRQFIRGPLNPHSSAHSAGSPNIMWIVMDTVRADHLSVYGYEHDTTPNLEKLAEQATVYTNAIAPGDYTLPSHASMFTGLYSQQHGADFVPDSPLGRPLADEFHTLPEIIAEKDYTTISISANYAFLGSAFGLIQGFQRYETLTSLGLFRCEYCLRRVLRPAVQLFSSSPALYSHPFLRAEGLNHGVFHYLDEVSERNGPFFLFVNYMDAHWPYDPLPPFDTRFPGKGKINIWKLQDAVLKLERRMTEKERRHLISQYDGAIAYLDFHLEKLFARLKQLNLYDECLLIVTSDHGEALGERNFLTHSNSVYQDQVHVPLIIKYPKVTEKVVVNEFVSLVDLAPTILDVLGCDIPTDMQGQSLLKLKRDSLREIFTESFSANFKRNLHPRFRRAERAIFRGSMKFISSTNGKRELYDLSSDPNEEKNLYDPDHPTSRQMEARVEEWVKSAEPRPGKPARLDSETLDRLRSLGYVK